MTVIPYPVAETLVVVPVYDGVAQTELLHEPAPFKRTRSEDGEGRRVYLEALVRNNGAPPYEWPSACGLVGVVYIRDGLLANSPMCAMCAHEVAALAPRVEVEGITHGTRHGYTNLGCRCFSCTQAHTDYSRAYRRRKVA